MTDKSTDLTVPSELQALVTTEAPRPSDEASVPRFAPEDMAIPRLAIAQKTSPEVEEGNPKFVEGLKYTDLFHSMDHRNFKSGPLLFCILRYDPPRYMHLRPFDQGGGIIEMNVPPDDPRTKWGSDPRTGASIKPIATKFLDYYILLLNGFNPQDPMDNVMALSLKSTGLRAAKNLNRLMNWRGTHDLWRAVYRVTSGTDKNKLGQPFAIYKFGQNGWLAEGTFPFAVAQELHNSLKDADIPIDRDVQPDPADDGSFDTAAMDAETINHDEM